MIREREYKRKSFVVRTFNFAISMFNLGIFYFLNFLDKFENNKYLICNENETKKWKPNSLGLFVAIHGLCGDISSFGHYLSKYVEKINSNYDIILPKVKFGGNCKLNIASDQILSLILNYIHENPKKPIYIFATSNGSRIASYIEINLRHLNVDISIFSFAGAYGGSRNFNNLKYLVSLFYDSDLVEDLSLNSKVNEWLKCKMNEKFNTGTRYYEFFAAANDLHIPNLDDSFPEITERENIFVKYHSLQEYYEHMSLARFNIKKILDAILK